MNKNTDDEQLLAELRAAVAGRAAVPAAFIAAARSAYAWHHIDAELAQLVYDSQQDAGLSASLRSEAATIRALTFASALFSIEVEVTDEALLGQLVPPRAGTVETQTLAGETTGAEIDEIGCFSIEPKPDGQFRLRFRTQDQPDVLTGWLALLI
ncbi:MAG: hypothetical protein ABSA02_15215 [Trebonia sp.]